MKHILAMTLVGLMTLGGSFFAGVALGETERGTQHHERHMERGEHHGPGSRHHEHHAEHHGREAHQGHHEAHYRYEGRQGHHRAHHRSMDKELFAQYWKGTLTTEQQLQVDQLRVNHAKANAPLKAKIASIKTDLAVLATAEQPDTATIQQRIDELLELKKKAMQQRYAHIAAVRKVLTQEQRVSYDMMILKHAKKRKRGGKR